MAVSMAVERKERQLRRATGSCSFMLTTPEPEHGHSRGTLWIATTQCLPFFFFLPAFLDSAVSASAAGAAAGAAAAPAGRVDDSRRSNGATTDCRYLSNAGDAVLYILFSTFFASFHCTRAHHVSTTCRYSHSHMPLEMG